jgi:hypothetical protein
MANGKIALAFLYLNLKVKRTVIKIPTLMRVSTTIFSFPLPPFLYIRALSILTTDFDQQNANYTTLKCVDLIHIKE